MRNFADARGVGAASGCAGSCNDRVCTSPLAVPAQGPWVGSQPSAAPTVPLVPTQGPLVGYGLGSTCFGMLPSAACGLGSETDPRCVGPFFDEGGVDSETLVDQGRGAWWVAMTDEAEEGAWLYTGRDGGIVSPADVPWGRREPAKRPLVRRSGGARASRVAVL